MLFNIFIYLHLFNQINCRKVKDSEYNIFEKILSNFYFLGVFLGVFVVQHFFVQWGGKMTRCAKLTGQEHAFSILVGSTSIIAGFILKSLPKRLDDKIPSLIDEKRNLSKDRIVQFYNAQASAKVVNKPAPSANAGSKVAAPSAPRKSLTTSAVKNK